MPYASSRGGGSNTVLSDLYQHPTTNLLPFRDVMVEGSSYALNEEVLLSSRLFPIAYADDDVGSISRSRPGARTALFDARVDGMRRAVSAMDPLQVSTSSPHSIHIDGLNLIQDTTFNLTYR